MSRIADQLPGHENWKARCMVVAEDAGYKNR